MTRNCEMVTGCKGEVVGCLVIHAKPDHTFLGEALRTCRGCLDSFEARAKIHTGGPAHTFVHNFWERRTSNCTVKG